MAARRSLGEGGSARCRRRLKRGYGCQALELHREVGVFISRSILITMLLSLAVTTQAFAKSSNSPCDKYPPAKQSRCTEIWKELNQEDAPIIAQFGLDQQKRREEGKINAQQHLAENMTFIKQSTEKRLERLKERLAQE